VSRYAAAWCCLCALLVWFGWPSAALCQVSPPNRPTSNLDSIAHQLAPVISFAPFERYFPSLPFFTAFDGVDNDIGRPGARDFDDLDEVAPVMKNAVSWRDITRAYDGLVLSGIAQARCVLFYHAAIMTQSEVEMLGEFLESDRNAWRRSGLAMQQMNGSRMVVIQYFLYYVRDAGLTGHDHDIEVITVFTPESPNPRGQFAVWIGGGHSSNTPNNTLVVFPRWPDAFRSPHFLVELGGHSNAPDVPPYGEFQPGLDANWFIGDLWGTRDLQASHGVAWTGRYQTWMTMKRDTLYSVRLFPPRDSSQVKSVMTVDSSNSSRIPTFGYALVPISLPGILFSKIDDPSTTDLDLLRMILTLRKELLRGWSYNGGSTSELTQLPSLSHLSAFILRFRLWQDSTVSRSGRKYSPDLHSVWKNIAVRNPLVALKVGRQWTDRTGAGLVWDGEGGTRLTGWFEMIRTEDLPVFVPGQIFTQVEFPFDFRHSADSIGMGFGFGYRSSRKQALVWTAELMSISTPNDGDSGWVLGGGISIRPWKEVPPSNSTLGRVLELIRVTEYSLGFRIRAGHGNTPFLRASIVTSLGS
jgi:hypothetical protein